jgi:hypothetical protein
MAGPIGPGQVHDGGGAAGLQLATAVLPRPGAWPTVLPIGLRRRISSQLNNAGCPWPAAMRPKRSGRRRAGLRNPSTNSDVVAKTGGGQTSRGPRLGCGRLTCSSFSLSPAPHPRSGPKIRQFPLTTSRAEASPSKRIGLPSPTAYPPAGSAHFLSCLIERSCS